jgi:hypothetical protein
MLRLGAASVLPWIVPAATATHLAQAVATSPRGYITFAINVHDWTHPNESAETLLALVDLFERHGVRGDFYFTPEIARALADERPEAVDRIRSSAMTISYHVRPPHPLCDGFDGRLAGLSEVELEQVLLDYETYALDLTTGDLDRSRAGGYTFVTGLFGRKPVVASGANSDPRINAAARRVYASLGAQMTVIYHESGTSLETPFVWVDGLLVRPSDFSVTRTTPVDGGEGFWWNKMTSPDADRYDPAAMVQLQLSEWEAREPGRAPFITALIHENNFSRRGAEGWSEIYYAMQHGQRAEPLSPPFDLTAPDPSRLRPPAERDAIFAAYERLVAFSARNLAVVTSEDILELAR